MTDHPPGDDPADPMSKPPSTLWYEIRVRGRLGPTLLEAFPRLTARPCEDGTLLAGSLPDQSAVYGVLRQLEALGIELVELRRCDSPAK
jgi:hypothetical protein